MKGRWIRDEDKRIYLHGSAMTSRKPKAKDGFEVTIDTNESSFRSRIVTGTFTGEPDRDSWEVKLGATFGGWRS